STNTVFFSLLAIFTALTTVATIAFVIPFPSTQGYFNLGDTFAMLSGFLLGPVGGFFAGGAGSALGDVFLGFPAFVPITFLAKGSEGFLVGLLSFRTQKTSRVSGWDVLSLFLGSLAMLMGYMVGEVFLLGFSFEIAFAELLAINSVQVIMGSVFTITVGPLLRTYLKQHFSQDEDAPEEDRSPPDENGIRGHHIFL
ncbi:MAG: ECF transporter S component, partial [Promethearchaeota archaeon]